MEVIGKSKKIGAFEIARVLDNFGNKQILLKYYKRKRNSNSFDFFNYQSIFIKPREWKEFLVAIKVKKHGINTKDKEQ